MPTRKELNHATKLVDKLIADELLELEDGADTTTIVDAVAAQLVLWTDNYDRSEDLADLLAAHPQIAEVFASDDDLRAAIARWRQAVRGPTTTAVITDERNPELEATLRTEPDDDLAAVYADWLIEHGNPLGDLFACATDDKARRRVLNAHGPTLWGPLAEYKNLFDITWGRLGAHAITVERTTALELEWGRVIGALLDRPLAAFCRALHIGPLPYSAHNQYEDMLDHIAARPRRALHHLTLTPGDGSRAPVGIADLDARFPDLRHLVVAGRRVDTPVLAHPTLEHLSITVESPTILGSTLTRVELPRLHSLELHLPWIGSWDARDVVTLSLPSLRRFGVGSCERQHVEAMLTGILRAPWLAQLEELDLSGIWLDPTCEALLARHREQLAHLRLVVQP